VGIVVLFTTHISMWAVMRCAPGRDPLFILKSMSGQLAGLVLLPVVMGGFHKFIVAQQDC